MNKSETELIAAYLDGDLDAEGVARLEVWLLAEPAHREQFTRIARFDLRLRGAVAGRLARRSAGLDTARLQAMRRHPRQPFQWSPWVAFTAMAASVMVVCALAWPQFQGRVAGLETSPAQAHVVTVLPANTLYTGPCQITVADGSRLALADKSQLRLDRLSGGVVATLLVGSVRAVVTHQVGQATVSIATAHLTVTVVGTHFDVTTNPTDSQVSVVEGRVRVVDTRGVERLVDGGDSAWANAAGQARRVLVVEATGTVPAAGAFRSLTEAAAMAKPGDRIVLRPGRHLHAHDDQVHSLIRCQGSAERWITIAGDPGGQTVIESESIDALRCEEAAYLHISNLSIRPARNAPTALEGNGIHVLRSHHVTIATCDIQDMGGDGVLTKRSGQVTITGNQLRGCGQRSTWGQGGIAICSSVVFEDIQGPHIRITGNRVTGSRTNAPNQQNEWNGGHAIGVYRQRPGDAGKEYRGCTAPTLIADNVCADNDGAGIVLYRVDNVQILNNILHRNAAGRGGLAELGLFSAHGVHFADNVLAPRPGKQALSIEPEDVLPGSGIVVWGTKESGFTSLTSSPYLTPCADENRRTDFHTRPGFLMSDDTPGVRSP